MGLIRKVYLDTSVISALFDKRTPERMALIKTAWKTLKDYDVYISELVVDELSAAPDYKKLQFMDAISNFTVIKITKETENLAHEYIAEGIFPEKCYKCKNRTFAELTELVIEDHLIGKEVIVVYPMLSDETCKFLAIDFDGGNWQKDVTTIR